MSPELSGALVDFSGLKLKCTSFVRLGCDQEILERAIRRLFNTLLKRAHEAVPWMYLCADLRILQLKQQSQLSCNGITKFGNFVPGTTNLDEVLAHSNLLAYHSYWQTGHSVQILSLLSFSSRTASKICLMLATLGMSEVRSIILMHSEAETTFERSDMVLEAIKLL